MNRSIATVVRTRRIAMGLTQKALAKRAGVSQGTIANLELGTRGASGQIPATIPLVAGALGITTDTLLEEAGIKRPTHLGYDRNVALAAPTHSVRAVPMIDWIQAGQMAEMTDPYEVGAGETVVWTDPDYGPRTVALTIRGDSMEPEYREGDIIIVDPDVSPGPGDGVVAKNAENEATFKKYRPRGINANGENVFELVPLNDDYPTLRSDREPLRVIGVVVEHRKRRRPR